MHRMIGNGKETRERRLVTLTIQTNKYDIDLEKLLARRLDQCYCEYSLETDADGIFVSVEGDDARSALSDALSRLLCRDLQYFELAHMADNLPLTLPQKQEVLTIALENARAEEPLSDVRAALYAYLADATQLNLAGYLQFRMQSALTRWELLVERAAADQALCRSYAELIEMLRAYAADRPPNLGEVSVCLHPDGSCTLTDETDACIEYVDCSEDGILRLLISMAPARLTVYDLSEGTSGLPDALRQVFAGRIRIYR